MSGDVWNILLIIRRICLFICFKKRTFFETQIVMKDTAWRLQCTDNKMIISCPCLEIGQRVTL